MVHFPADALMQEQEEHVGPFPPPTFTEDNMIVEFAAFTWTA